MRYQVKENKLNSFSEFPEWFEMFKILWSQHIASVIKLVQSICVGYHFVLQVLEILNDILIPKVISFMVMANVVYSRIRTTLLND